MKKILIAPVRFYQRFISPLFPPSCRYYPTCSAYMITAIEVHGALKGLLMGIARILRCQPFAKGGLDYVPQHFSLKKMLSMRRDLITKEVTHDQIEND